MEEKKTYSFEEFVEIIERLRAKDGCPWDRVQTHESLRPCMMEEAAEFLSSVRIYGKTGNAENMQEELGDILLQVVMHSVIAKEEKLFSVDEVITEVSEKMIRRHPHIFGTGKADTADEVLDNWDEIKKKEKEGKTWIESPLREIPKELPALTRAPKVLKKVDKLYEKGPSAKETMASLLETAQKLQDEKVLEDKGLLENLMGDLLVQVAQIGRQNRLSLEQILTDRVEDIIEKNEPSV